MGCAPSSRVAAGATKPEVSAGASIGAGAAAHAQQQALHAPPVVPRQQYDDDLRELLLGHSSPQTVEMTAAAAAVFVARARMAHKIVQQRRAEAGCGSDVAMSYEDVVIQTDGVHSSLTCPHTPIPHQAIVVS